LICNDIYIYIHIDISELFEQYPNQCRLSRCFFLRNPQLSGPSLDLPTPNVVCCSTMAYLGYPARNLVLKLVTVDICGYM
jgi:hypothetical protein